MGGQKSFYTCWGGFKKFWQLAKGEPKKFHDENFQLPSPPHQSIYEHSLTFKWYDVISSTKNWRFVRNTTSPQSEWTKFLNWNIPTEYKTLFWICIYTRTFLNFDHFMNEPGLSFLVFFQTFRDINIYRKIIFFSFPEGNFEIEMWSIWKLLVETRLIIKLTH